GHGDGLRHQPDADEALRAGPPAGDVPAGGCGHVVAAGADRGVRSRTARRGSAAGGGDAQCLAQAACRVFRMPTVLVIDDNPAVATALDLLLSLHDIDTRAVTSPEDGLA